MPMYYFNFHTLPANPDVDPDAGGAFVNCWIQESNIEAAEIIARQGIEDSGWTITDYEEQPRKTNRDCWGEDKLVYYDQALIDREVWVFHRYPIEDEE
jgi:hypothetical protein